MLIKSTVVLHVDDNKSSIGQVSRTLRGLGKQITLKSAQTIEEAERKLDHLKKQDPNFTVDLVILDLILGDKENSEAEKDDGIPAADDGAQLGGLYVYKKLVNDKRVRPGTPILIRSMLKELDTVPDRMVAECFRDTPVWSIPKAFEGNEESDWEVGEETSDSLSSAHSIVSELDAILLFKIAEIVMPNYLPTGYTNSRSGREVEVPYIGSADEVGGIRQRLEGLFRRGRQHFCVVGESGTGKELVARAIFNLIFSGQDSARFVPVNVPALSAELGLSRLVGTRGGYLPGVPRDVPGFLSDTQIGAVVFDETDSMDPKIQDIMLRIVEEREFVRLGDNTPTKLGSDVLLIFLMGEAKKPIGKQLQDGDFREDLWSRIKSGLIRLSPLRGHAWTIKEIVREYAPVAAERHLRKYRPEENFSISGCVWEKVFNYHWPGNKRELIDILDESVEHAIVACRETELRGEHFRLPSDKPKKSVFEAMLNPGLNKVERFKAKEMFDAITRANGVQAEARRQIVSSNGSFSSSSSRWRDFRNKAFDIDKLNAYIKTLKPQNGMTKK